MKTKCVSHAKCIRLGSSEYDTNYVKKSNTKMLHAIRCNGHCMHYMVCTTGIYSITQNNELEQYNIDPYCM